MADKNRKTNGPSPYDDGAANPWDIPDFQTEFIKPEELDSFAQALNAPDTNRVTALNDWRPVQQRVRRKHERGRRKKPRRNRDETREGHLYSILKWPMLLVVFSWIFVLGLSYLLTRLYVWAYERLFAWRGERQRLRQELRSKTNYADWIIAAKKLDSFLGTELWKEQDEYAYYDHVTVKRVKNQLRQHREQASDRSSKSTNASRNQAVEELRSLVEACAKGNFAGTENPKIYHETYYGTKNLIQEFIDELERSLSFLLEHSFLPCEDKFTLSKHLHTNLGRTALCLSGGASFAYYHFGVVKALLDANLLPDVVTGTSGGALVAALVATRTNEELKALIVPALSYRITACEENFSTWLVRWWRTGARFDSLQWARKCSWFTRGSMTFKEAYERTGRILNITCIPSDPHSPTILANYLTAPNCVIWSAVLASAAVPGILNPVVLMMKTRDGTLAPYSFGHKWKDGSLRTDIPLRALNLHFNVNFSIVSQVNPHINLFFFSSRGTVGRPVTHRRGRGWRGGFLGSAIEQYLKLDLSKWLKVLRHLELLPRPLGQDWSEIWLQNFSGTITIWPRSKASDFAYILSDPNPKRLARMIQVGQSSTFPKLLFIANRMKIERLIEQGLLLGKGGRDSMHLGGQARRNTLTSMGLTGPLHSSAQDFASWTSEEMPLVETPTSSSTGKAAFSRSSSARRLSGTMEELRRQSLVFFDDTHTDGEDTEGSAVEEEEPFGQDVVEGGATRVG
ncbi:MAG: hypothetical protein LQ340_003916 [Diploschistes diacapsis]|nr:MAG: hypothetical protein LQ340_003916 [Diploschistes diacapsis]